MIVVLGRPEVQRPEPDGELTPGGLAAEIALALGRQDVAVEIVGSIGDDPEGDRVVIELGRADVGHAALLRDPAARTPIVGRPSGERPLPRLDAADVELGLRYVPKCRVLVLADELEPDTLATALEAADYHSSAVVMIAAAGSVDASLLPDSVTLLERPEPEDEEGAADAASLAADDADFAGFIAEYAMRLDRGEAPADAFGAALGDSAWEPSADEGD
jgi:sugar/nucleoside kinase (ribokinase family)